MKKIIRLSESQLTNIIKRVISEAESTKGTLEPVKIPGPTGSKCKDPWLLFTYTSSSQQPTYMCNGVNGWYACGTDEEGRTKCCCGKAGSK